MGLWLPLKDDLYAATFSAIAVTAAQDVFEIVAPATKRLVIKEVRIGQYSDAGDAEAELLSVLIMRGHTTTGSGGATITPAKMVSDASRSAQSTVKRNNTTVATGGSPVTLVADAWNVQAGAWVAPNDGDEILVAVSERLVVRITAPADSITLNGTLLFAERDPRV